LSSIIGISVTEEKSIALQQLKFDDEIVRTITRIERIQDKINVQIGTGVITFKNFNKKTNSSWNFESYDEEENLLISFNWGHELINCNNTNSFISLFENSFHEAIEHLDMLHSDDRLAWPCAAGAAVAAVGVISVAVINHCDNAIELAAEGCNACLDVSFCDANCVACPK
jgi:hypothetical protein